MQVFEANDIQETRCLMVLKMASVHSTDISNKKTSISDGMRRQVRSTRPLFTRMIRIIIGADEEGQNFGLSGRFGKLGSSSLFVRSI